MADRPQAPEERSFWRYVVITLPVHDNIDCVIRTQISLTEEQMRRLRAEARRRGMPIAAVVREAVDQVVPVDVDAQRATAKRALAAVGRFDSKTGDVAQRHDAIAGEGGW